MYKHRIKSWHLVSAILLINFVIRLIIYYNTKLFSFSDYSAYLGGIDNIAAGNKQYLLIGNFLFAISYMGYFSREIMGSLDWFFIFNCLLGSVSGLIIYWLIVRITRLKAAGIITLVILTLYTEFMVFSSVFYTPVIMIFLLSLFMMMLYFILNSPKKIIVVLSGVILVIIFLLTFFFKPELKFLPLLFLIAGISFIKMHRNFSVRLLSLSFLLFTFSFLPGRSGLITAPEGNTISNAFIFFGHTDYGGDGGEGSFVYPGNKERYDAAAGKYFYGKGISNPNTADYNDFQREEIKKYITEHPVKWAGLQAKKFFRTFGVVPETNSFKVLYTGLLKGRLWLTSAAVVAPVAGIILLLIIFSPVSRFRRRASDVGRQVLPVTEHSLITDHPRLNDAVGQGLPITISDKMFLYIYMLLFIYYLLASIFYGHYQERYRLPIMVVFIIPALGYYIASFNRREFLNKSGLYIKGVIIVLFLTIWVFQVKRAFANRERLSNAIELMEEKGNR